MPAFSFGSPRRNPSPGIVIRPSARRLFPFIGRAGGLALLAWLAAPAARALAHEGQPPAPHDIWAAWSWEPAVLIGLAFTGWAYASGIRALWQQAGPGRGVSRRQALAFAAGLLFVFIALISPVDRLGEAIFAGHMVQHMLLIYVAGPLLVYGAPPAALAWAVPGRWRVPLSRGWHRQKKLRSLAGFAVHPFTIWVLHAAAMWVWHLPRLYDLAVANPIFHALEHASFLGTALLFWWAVLYGMRQANGVGFSILYLFTMMLISGLLGALITFAPAAWYTSHLESTAAWNLTPLEDQQLAGVIMWVPAGIVYLGIVLARLGSLISQQEQKDRSPVK